METSFQTDLGAVYAAAIQGARSQQQDAVRTRWLADEGALLIVLADGMGGHAAGDLASKIAVDAFVSAFASLRDSKVELEESFRGALLDANARIAAVQSARPETAGMGTTLVAAYVTGQGVCWISVGDSLLMLYRNGVMAHLNEDHSLRSLGSDARAGASANMLTSALSGGPIRKIDLNVAPVALGGADLLVVASDGVMSLTDEEVAGVLAASEGQGVEVATEALIESVNRLNEPRQDNCTIAMFSPTGQIPQLRRKMTTAARLAIVLLLAALAAATIATYRHYF